MIWDVNNGEESGSVNLCHAESVEDSSRQGYAGTVLVLAAHVRCLSALILKTQNTQLQHESCTFWQCEHQQACDASQGVDGCHAAAAAAAAASAE